MTSDFGRGMVFPPSWARSPADDPQTVACERCGRRADPDEGLCVRCLRGPVDERRAA
jgi:hypothetical protein